MKLMVTSYSLCNLNKLVLRLNIFLIFELHVKLKIFFIKNFETFLFSNFKKE